MSYDISIKREVYENNYTSNVYKMFVMAFGNNEGIKILNGMTMVEARKELTDAIKYFENNEEDLMIFNPTNGWGNYKGALDLLESMLINCNLEIEAGYEYSEFEVTC